MKQIALYVLPGILMTACCWGTYGAVLHKGQGELGGDRLKPFICVGFAYFIVGILVPLVILLATGNLGGDWTMRGIVWSTAAGVAGAFGALGLILALTGGGHPIYVMPLVFGGAPIVNVVVAAYLHGGLGQLKTVSPLFYVGMVMVVAGASLVLVYKPKPAKHSAPAHAAAEPEATPDPAAGRVS